jgi:ribokinase
MTEPTPPHDPPSICVVGSSNIDLTFRTSRLPATGETLTGHGFHLGYGGKGGNQAVMAARLGARVTLVSRVGRDVFGEGALANYRSAGIDTTHVYLDDGRPSGVAGIVVDDQARNCILVVPGANQKLSAADVRRAIVPLQSASVLLCQLEVPLGTTLEAFRLAHAARVRTILNPAPAVPLPEELLRLTDLCVPNETELELLTGRTILNQDDVADAARLLLERGPSTVLVTLGGRGALVVGPKLSQHVAAPVVEAVDSTGAGDAFIGSLGVFLASGVALVEAVRRACAVAALSVTRLGTQASYPARAEVMDFLSRL